MTKESSGASKSRYEFRVWGDRSEVGDRLSSVADSERQESLKDWYLLVGDRARSLKVRRSRLKVKRLVEERFGFQRWSSDWYSLKVRESADLVLDPGQAAADGLEAMTGDGHDLATTLRPVLVTKHRKRFRCGSVRAEMADLEIDGRTGRLCTVAIEGRNLVDLIHLRSTLGIDLVPNVAVPWVLDPLRMVADQSSVSVAPSSR
jgi:hypothetical protein